MTSHNIKSGRTLLRCPYYVQKFFDLLKASEEPLHEYTIFTIHDVVIWLMSIKIKFAFSYNYYKDLVNLISDVLSANHKMPKDMY